MPAPGIRTTVPRLVSILLVLLGIPVIAASYQPTIIGEHIRDVVLETPHPYPPASGKAEELVWSDRFFFPEAAYLVFEFQAFDLAPGDRVELRDPAGKQVQVLRGKGFREKGGDFITRMIAGPEAIIELYSINPSHDHYGYRIERITRGYSDAELNLLGIGPDAVCGVQNGEDAVCYQVGFPQVYERSRPVARIVMDGAAICTAWIVSCDNHLITNNHCTWQDSNFDSQAELDRMEFQFMYQNSTCGGLVAEPEYSFLGGTWLENDHDLDYTLIRAPAGEDPAATYGWLRIDDRLAAVDERIYIVGHPGFGPKQINLYSTDPSDQDNPDGFCEVYSTSEPACIGGTTPEIGYFCDTDGGSSGSPVLSRDTNQVVALHHCANCPNRGVRIQEIWDHNQGGAHPLPICSLFGAVGSAELDRGRYGCADTITVSVTDASIQGTGATAVSLWSDTEPIPETTALTETPAGSGTFVGAFATAAVPAVSGDGMLSVTDGDAITVRYIDADDGQGGIDVPRDAAAAADCIGPSIGNVRATDILGTSARIAWESAEPADSEVLYAASAPPWSSETDPSLVTAHVVGLAGLTECTTYAFRVQSTDEAGNATIADNGGGNYSFTTGADNRDTPGSTDTPLAITDLSNTYSTITVGANDPVLDVQVTVNIAHLFDADLDIYLEGPDGTEIALSTDNGGSGVDYTGTVFDDAAALSIRSGTAPFTGSYRPEEPLSIFDGITAAGDWTLRVFDDEIGDAGTLESWSLELIFPPRPCGPHAVYQSHALEMDDCALGGAGDADGTWDGGEEIDFQVWIENDGTDPLTGVGAVLSALTPGVTVINGAGVYGNLAAGTVGGSTAPYMVHLPDNIACGATVEYQADISAAEGAWIIRFVHPVGEILPTSGVALDEDFDAAGIPATWTVIDGGGPGNDTWYTDNAGDPARCANQNPNAPMGGNWAAVDSDCAGEVDMDESLIAPVLDLGTALTVTLEFDHYFNRSQTELADCDVRSSLTGGSWINVGRWTADTSNPVHEAIDITAVAAGASDVEIRWRYHGANFAWYWYVDNVLVSYTAAGGCRMETCPTGSPPGEQTGAAWPDLSIFSWDLDPQASSGYTLYRGTPADLPALGSSTADSCIRFTGAGPADNAADLSADSPPVGGLFWYLVTGWNTVGEGTAGSGTPGSRIVNATGPCGP